MEEADSEAKFVCFVMIFGSIQFSETCSRSVASELDCLLLPNSFLRATLCYYVTFLPVVTELRQESEFLFVILRVIVM